MFEDDPHGKDEVDRWNGKAQAAGISSHRPHGSQFCATHTDYIAPCCPICLIEERDRLRQAAKILDTLYAEWMTEKQGNDLVDGLDGPMEDAKKWLLANAAGQTPAVHKETV